jgi:hypothetical protein
MRRTIYLPDNLNENVEAYLAENPGMTLSHLVQQLLEERVTPHDLSALLELAGIVTEKSGRIPEQPEDQVVDRIE